MSLISRPGSGGIIEAEFLVQALQMRSRHLEPRIPSARSTSSRPMGLREKQDAEALRPALRIVNLRSASNRFCDDGKNKGVSSLPITNKREQEKAPRRRIGAKSLDEFRPILQRGATGRFTRSIEPIPGGVMGRDPGDGPGVKRPPGPRKWASAPSITKTQSEPEADDEETPGEECRTQKSESPWPAAELAPKTVTNS